MFRFVHFHCHCESLTRRQREVNKRNSGAPHCHCEEPTSGGRRGNLFVSYFRIPEIATSLALPPPRDDNVDAAILKR